MCGFCYHLFLAEKECSIHYCCCDYNKNDQRSSHCQEFQWIACSFCYWKCLGHQDKTELILGRWIFILFGLRCELIYMGFWTPFLLWRYSSFRLEFITVSRQRGQFPVYKWRSRCEELCCYPVKLLVHSYWPVDGLCPVYFQISSYYSYCQL
jgi:hypothetical protein